MHWRALAPKDVLAIAFGAALLALGAYAWLSFPASKTNYGFGPEWVCTPTGKGDPICFKKGAETGDGQSDQPAQP
jgi:hypothetical protein